MATNVSLSTSGVSAPATAPVGTQDPVIVGASPPKPKSKARLLFNTDGSVKLLGDPSLFPGSGIDSNSHHLVPTVGPDGKMTMLLTPMGSGGKTFILNPTNGCSLPKTFPLLNPVTKTSNPSAVLAVTNSCSSSNVGTNTSNVVINTQPNPVVIKTNEFKSSPQQKSLLSGLGTINTAHKPPDPSSQFVTHMRIDPTGACTSTVKVPVDKDDDEKGQSRSTALKAIADKINPDNASQPKKSLLSNILESTGKKKSVLETKPTSTTTYVIAPNGKIVHESKSNWTNLSSVSPQTPNIVLHQNHNNEPKSFCPKTVYPPRIVPPLMPRISLSGASQIPTATKDKPLTYILLPTTTPDSAQSGPQSVTYSSKNVSSTPSTSTVSSVPQIRLSEKSQITVPSKYFYKTLGSDGDGKFVVYPTQPDPTVTAKYSHVKGEVIAPDDNTKTISQSHQNLSNDPDPSTEDSKTFLNQDKANEKTSLDPKTGLFAPEPEEDEEDDSLCIKIDSVFSLSTKNETEDPPAVDIKEEPDDAGQGEASVEETSTISEPTTVTCNPAYVVLDRLSESQIANYKTSIVKCSDYCRKRTLNFLCSLGLVECEPTVHTIHPKQEIVENDNAESLSEDKESSVDDVKQSNKRKLENDDCEKVSKLTKKDCEENPKTASNVTEQSESKTGPIANGSPPTLNVRKVESPGAAQTKVLKFTKVNKERFIPKSKDVITSDSMQVKPKPTVVSKPVVSPHTPAPVKIQASKVMTGLPPVQLGVQSNVPITKVQDNSKKQYFLFNVNGQNILVPTSNDMQKPKAFMLKGNDPKLLPPGPASSKLPPALGKVSLLNRTIPPKVTTIQTNNSNQKRSLEVTLSNEIPLKVLKPEPQKKEEIIPGIRIKSEPITHGYGDEEPIKSKSSRKSKVKVKKEPVNNEWQEIWSSSSTPVPDPTPVPKTKPKPLKTSSKGSEKPEEEGEQTPRSPDMPDLPMMRVPSSEEIAKSSATHNDRIERLKALLKSKEKLIEDLKEKRLKEGNILDDELFADSRPSVSPVMTQWDSNTGQTITDEMGDGATVKGSSQFDKVGSSDTESCEPSWSSFDVNDDIN